MMMIRTDRRAAGRADGWMDGITLLSLYSLGM